jgi:hypothetical protein
MLHSEHLTMMCLISKALTPPETFTLHRGFPPSLFLECANVDLPHRFCAGLVCVDRVGGRGLWGVLTASLPLAGLGLAQLNWEYLSKVQNRALQQAFNTHVGGDDLRKPCGTPTGLDYATFAHNLLSVADAWAGKPAWKNYVAFLSCLFNRITHAHGVSDGQEDEDGEQEKQDTATAQHAQKQKRRNRTWLHIKSIRLCPHHNHQYVSLTASHSIVQA